MMCGDGLALCLTDGGREQVYCQYHTAYSPHGPLVGCDLESKCICMVDWTSLNSATRVRLWAQLLTRM